MKASAAAPAVLWLVPLIVLCLVGAFVWQAISGPSDGAHLPPGEMVWQLDGVIVTPWVERPGGLQRGDRVIAVAGQSIAAWSERLFHISAMSTRWQVGETVPYTVVRAGQPLTVVITLEPYPWALVWRTYWGAFLFALAFPLLGTFVLNRRPGVRATQLFFVACWCFGPPYIPWVMGLQIGDLIERDNFWLYRAMILVFVGFVAFIHLAFHLFPEAHSSLSKSSAFIFLLYSAPFLLQLALLLTAKWAHLDVLNLLRWWYLSDRVLTLFGLGGVILVFLKSYYQMTHGTITQQQIRGIVFTISLIGGIGMLLGMAPEFIIGQPMIPYNNLFFLFALQIPLALLLAILRDHLFDIQFILNRTLVYVTLSTTVLVIYITLTGVMRILLQTNRVEASLLITTTLTALFFQPLYTTVQQRIDRLLPGTQERSIEGQPRNQARLRRHTPLHQVFDLHILINRTLVYGALTAIVVGIYALVVGALGSLSQASGNWLVSFIATGLVALLFQPLRQRLQRAVNHLVYGERDDPYAVLSRLGRRLESTLAPEAIPSTITETVAQTLKLPYAAVTLRQEEAFVMAAEYANAPHQQPPPTLIFPLFYQTEIVGQLCVAPRTVGETFTPGEQRLLEDIAHQAGIAVHAVRLASDLQRSRQRLVTAREEERRRLRRDLHDGLGPVLAGLMLKVDTARDHATDPIATEQVLLDMKRHLQTAITDIRRLIYNLRPPALDEFGLVGAVQEYLLQLNLPATLEIRLEPTSFTREQLPPLPAALEVAAYRIIQEAVTNVIRHAQAHQALVCLTLEQSNHLCIEVRDDGRGLPPGWHAGVGVTAMRERVAELSGVCVIESLPGGGVTLLARLPWQEE